MEPVRDYLTRKEIGIRIKEQKTCRVVRVYKGEWIEFGPEYELPMDPELLKWTPPGIPPSTLAVALKIYELDNPWSDLRALLSERSKSPSTVLPRHTSGKAFDGAMRPKSPKTRFPARPRKSQASR